MGWHIERNHLTGKRQMRAAGADTSRPPSIDDYLSIVSYRFVLYCVDSTIVLHWYRIASYRIVSCRIVSYRRIVSVPMVSYQQCRIVSYRTVSYGTVSYRCRIVA